MKAEKDERLVFTFSAIPPCHSILCPPKNL